MTPEFPITEPNSGPIYDSSFDPINDPTQHPRKL